MRELQLPCPSAGPSRRQAADVPSSFWTSHRRSVASRIVAAVLGGYVFTTVSATFFVRLLGLTPADSVTTALLASFLIYAAAIMWAFAARTAARAWLGLLVPGAVFGAIVPLIGTGLPS